jgi:hypothetical protein
VPRRHTLASARVCPKVCPNEVRRPSSGSQHQSSSHFIKFRFGGGPVSSRRTVGSVLSKTCLPVVGKGGNSQIRYTVSRGFSLNDWRRRPDLNRGWRFCRFHRVLQVVESSCSLVSGTPRFSAVFGRSWTEVGQKLRHARQSDRHRVSWYRRRIRRLPGIRPPLAQSHWRKTAHRPIGPGRAMNRCVKSESTASASRIPTFSITTKLKQSTKL